MKSVRKIIEINEELCDGCGQCVPSCAEGSIQIINGKARVVSDNLCDGLGACLGHCPQGALTIVEREAEAFDPEAVEQFLAQKASTPKPPAHCLSAQIQSLQPRPVKQTDIARNTTALSHWPVQIRLIPSSAPFLRDAHILVAADCAAISSPNFHTDYLQGRVVMMGCPKFDDTTLYLNKFVEIFQENPPKSITVLRMEVPCCSGLPSLVIKALEMVKAHIPNRIITLSRSGEEICPL